MKFFLKSGPLRSPEDVKTYTELAAEDGVPLILNGFYHLPQDRRKKMERIRNQFADDFDPAKMGSLDRHILKSDSVQGADYKSTLADHFRDLLTACKQLESNTWLVPGPFDLTPDDVRSIVGQYDIDGVPEPLLNRAYSYHFLDAEIDSPGSIESSMLGIGGVTNIDDGVPELIQHGEFHFLEQTSPVEAASLLSEGVDVLVLHAAAPGTHYEGNDSPGTFSTLERELNVTTLIADAVRSGLEPGDMATTVKRIPVLHALRKQNRNPAFYIHSNEGGELTVHVLERGERTYQISFDGGQWLKD